VQFGRSVLGTDEHDLFARGAVEVAKVDFEGGVAVGEHLGNTVGVEDMVAGELDGGFF